MKRIALLLIISATFLSACSSTNWVRTDVVKEYDFIVTLEEQQAKEPNSLQKHEHPYTIDLADLKTMMEDLTYFEKGSLKSTEKQSPVFQEVEIDRLTPALAEALAKADASQRIRFTSFNQGQAALFSISQKTEGVLFIAPEGRLNIAFNFINSKRSPSETSAIYHHYSKADPLKIKTSDTPLSVTTPYTELHQLETGQQAPMWIAADLEELKEAISIATAPNGIATAPTVNATEAVPPTLAATSATVAAPAEYIATAQASDARLKAEIRDKLKFLKELLNEGLISEEDYNGKKVELLDKLD